ncbi:hypothetical protein BH10PSE15_BH10PSE15_16230 [soil metagenome]
MAGARPSAPLLYLKDGEVGPAMGAARLAQIAVDGGSAAEVCVAPPVAHTIEPEAALVERLSPKRDALRATCPHITPKAT